MSPVNGPLKSLGRSSLIGSAIIVTVAVLALAAPTSDIASAQPAASAVASASASASVSASVSATPPSPIAAPASVVYDPPMAAREWPASESDEPTEEEWAATAVLRTVKRAMYRARDWRRGSQVECSERAIREWMRVTCEPDHSGVEDNFFGVVWGLAGDMSSVKGAIAPASTLARYQAPPQDAQMPITRLFGASATLTFRIKRGTALLLDIDTIKWDQHYDGGWSLSIRPGLIVDVSWARGEAGPTVAYQ